MIITLDLVAQAIHTINRHAKVSIYPPGEIYRLKKAALELLIKTGNAKKIGLDTYTNLRTGDKRILTSIRVGEYYFHTAATRADFETLSYLESDEKYHNPNPSHQMELSIASYVIRTYLSNPKIITVQNKPYVYSTSIKSRPVKKKPMRRVTRIR